MNVQVIPDVQLVENNSQRTPCVLVLDGSGSMRGDPIDELNEGLKLLERELKADTTASVRVQLLVIRAGDNDEVEILSDWTDAMTFEAPRIEANGRTPIGSAMALALDKIAEQKASYDANGIPSTRPWIMLISDGIPTDPDWEDAAARCRDAEESKRVAVFPIGTAEADLDCLGRFAAKRALRLDGLKFKELFLWLSRSVSTASKAAPDETTQLPAPEGWAQV
jgi:uncharacterized protein YegL